MQDPTRIAVLADAEITPEPAKTLTGMLRYRSGQIVTIIDRHNAGHSIGTVLGTGHTIPITTDVRSALDEHAPDALLLADEPVGAAIQPYWRDQVLVAVEAGIDVISGLHYRLSEDTMLSAAAERSGAKIVDLRKPPAELYYTRFNDDGRPVIEFREHRPGSRTVLAVGTDCGSGKMTTMLELERAAGRRNLNPFFLATGQVGMMLSGNGIAVDGLLADFINSGVEEFVFAATEKHDLVLVEGQGALTHPRYSAVTLGLVHGTRPDSMILCHELDRTAIDVLPECAIPSLHRAIVVNEQATQWLWPDNPARIAGISVMTGHRSDSDARGALAEIEAETGLPATDVLRYGPGRLLEAVLAAPGAPERS